jgi:hypothetical protein
VRLSHGILLSATSGRTIPAPERRSIGMLALESPNFLEAHEPIHLLEIEQRHGRALSRSLFFQLTKDVIKRGGGGEESGGWKIAIENPRA